MSSSGRRGQRARARCSPVFAECWLDAPRRAQIADICAPTQRHVRLCLPAHLRSSVSRRSERGRDGRRERTSWRSAKARGLKFKRGRCGAAPGGPPRSISHDLRLASRSLSLSLAHHTNIRTRADRQQDGKALDAPTDARFHATHSFQAGVNLLGEPSG